MTNCSAPRCKHSHNNCSVYRFPLDNARRMLWIKRSRRPFATTNYRLCKIKGGKRILVRNAIPTIFNSAESPKKKVKYSKKEMKNDENEKHFAESKCSAIPLRIADCWSEFVSRQDKNQAQRELSNALYETSNSIDDNSMESEKQSTDDQVLGLENVPIPDSDIAGESNIEFCYSAPKNVNDLTPILAKWSPRIDNVNCSIIEDLIDSSDDDEDRWEEGGGSNHVIYIDEDSVKQEEFEDENSEENFDSEPNKSSKKDKEESSGSFDEEKVKREFHINDNLRVELHKIIINEKSTDNYKLNLKPQNKTCCETSSKKKLNDSSNKKNLPKSSSCLEKSLKNRKTPQTNKRSKASHSNSRPIRTNATEPKSRSTTRINANNKRQSLRLSGKSPELQVPEDVPSLTRNGKKRLYEEPKRKLANSPVYTVADEEVSHRLSRTYVVKEPKIEEIPLSRSPSPMAYKKNFEVIFLCQCCDKKYASVEHVKAHIMTHFPDSAAN